MAEIRINATGGVKLYDADDSHYAQIIAGTITSNVDALPLGHASADFNIPVKVLGTTPTLTIGDAGAEDTAIVFDGNAKDFYVALDDSADKLVIGEGSTVGTNSILTITDDSITIGDAAAVDTKIVFDGNAQDFHIGLDDSSDSLTIGLGSALGTTSHIVINEAGIITKPLQTYVYAFANADQDVDADDADQTIELNAELKDTNADFNVSNYTFTAPVDGAYMCSAYIAMIEDTNTGITDWFFGFDASNGNEYGFSGNPVSLETASGSNYGKSVSFSKVIFMDASDTLTLFADCAGGSSLTFKVDGHANSYQATSMQIFLLG